MIGVKIISVQPSTATCRMIIRTKHRNSLGTVNARATEANVQAIRYRTEKALENTSNIPKMRTK